MSDRARLDVDYDFAVQTYLDYATSVFSDYGEFRNPSMQVSSLGDTQILAGVYFSPDFDLRNCQNIYYANPYSQYC